LYTDCIRNFTTFHCTQVAIISLLPNQPEHGSSLYFRVGASWSSDAKGFRKLQEFH